MLKQRFNKGWTVQTGDGGALSALLGQAAVPKPVTLPHDHLVEIPRNPNEPNGPGNGYFHEEDIVYKTELSLGESDAGKRVWLEFEGIYQNAFVYVNDAFAGKCAYGYSNFYLDITKFLQPGQPNAVKVVVKNGVPSGRWYTGGGIYRDVNLMIADPVHIVPDGVFVRADDISQDLAAIDAAVELANDTCTMKTVLVKAELTDAEGNAVASGQIPVTLGEAEKNTYHLRMYVKEPKLWDEETPNLYGYKVTILEGEEVKDEECGKFGIR